MATILDQIQALSNERQQLWRVAHRDKFSHGWWKRHDRIEVIGKVLNRLWHMHRIELAKAADHQSIAIDRMASEYFDEFRERAGVEPDGIWRIEDETNHHRRYMSIDEGFADNLKGKYLKKQTQKRSKRPNVGARARNRATQGMIQLN